jgi:transcriptional regulator with XRE-family HTH domain
MINITTWRENLGLSHRAAAARLGIARSTLWRYETGRITTPQVVLHACEGIELLCRISAGNFDPRKLTSEIDAFLRRYGD